MADYYSILTKTIAGLPTNTAESRSMVYSKARTAIDKQLRTREPAPSEEVIGRQLEMLEEAIEKVEANASIDQAISELNSAEDILAEEITDSELDQVAAATEPVTANKPAEATILAESNVVENKGPEIEDPGALDPAAIPEVPSIASVPEAQTSAVADPVKQDTHQPARRNAVVRVLPYLIGLIIVAGGAYALWMNQAVLLSTFDNTAEVNGNNGTEPSDVKAPGSANSVPDKPVRVITPDNNSSGQKDNVRLSETGESVEVEPVVPEPVTEPVREGETPIILDEDGAEQPDGSGEDRVEVSEVQNNETQQDPGNQTVSQPGATAVGQNAFLYEEGASGSGAARIPASIVWSLINEPPSDGLPSEPIIKGKLTVPDRGLTMDLTLKRNTDPGLPASHIIELIFEAPSDFSGGQIDNVARFVLKATEQARGDGLVAVPAKISNGFFLIALNNLPQAVETNTKLLTESSWIDIPMGYTTGRRALVTLEKGAVGDKVFRDAFEDWKNR